MAQKQAPAPQQVEAQPLPTPSRKADIVESSTHVPRSKPSPSHPAAPAQKASTVLKLKLGSSRPAPPAESSKPSQKSSVPKAKKQKAVDMPPPPYIDDGSHDLLQEVIAMEELERVEKSPFKSSSSKQRKVVELDPEEELLSLAAADSVPVLVKRMDVQKMSVPPSTPVRAPSPSTSVPVVPPPQLSAQVPITPKSTIPSMRLKKPVEKPVQLSPSIKGKEKEGSIGPLPPHVTGPARPRKSSTPLSFIPINEKKCREILKNIVKLPQAIIFARPVDPVLDGCPTYVFRDRFSSCSLTSYYYPDTMLKSRILWISGL